jgi:hypothetical protein
VALKGSALPPPGPERPERASFQVISHTPLRPLPSYNLLACPPPSPIRSARAVQRSAAPWSQTVAASGGSRPTATSKSERVSAAVRPSSPTAAAGSLATSWQSCAATPNVATGSPEHGKYIRRAKRNRIATESVAHLPTPDGACSNLACAVTGAGRRASRGAWMERTPLPSPAYDPKRSGERNRVYSGFRRMNAD